MSIDQDPFRIVKSTVNKCGDVMVIGAKWCAFVVIYRRTLQTGNKMFAIHGLLIGSDEIHRYRELHGQTERFCGLFFRDFHG